jgi:hypothetical protein
MIKLTELLDESDASEEAKRLGLDHMSFGRYGKDGKVTHTSQNGKLVPVDAEPADDASRIADLEKQKASLDFDKQTHPGRRDWGRASKRNAAQSYKTGQELDKLKGVEPKKYDYDPIGKFSDEPSPTWGSKSPNINKLSSMTPDEQDISLEKAVDAASYDIERAQERYDRASRNYDLDDNPSNEMEIEQELIDARDELEVAHERYDRAKREWEDFLERDEPSSTPMNATQAYQQRARELRNRSRMVRRPK